MYSHKSILSLLICLFYLISSAQNSSSIVNPVNKYFHSVKLYEDGKYEIAKYSFRRILKNHDLNSEIKENCHYYLVMCAVKLDTENNEELIFNFIEKFPTSSHKNTLFLEVGNHFYNNEKPAASLKWLQKASPKYLTTKQEEDYNFKIGYALFSNKKYTEAKEYLLPLTHSKNYLDEANYYYGYISYLQEDFATALKYFKKLKDNDKYKKEILYYLMNIQFTEGKYQEVIKNGKNLLNISSKKKISEISKIIGESYFYLEKYAEAIPYLKKYKGKKNRLNTTDHYFLGYAYYKESDYENAAITFNKIIKGKDAVAQNAYYHLADCYLRSNKKSEALNAFKNCSELDFDQNIKENAWFNYAKLSYEIGNPYKNTAEVLQNFVEKYPYSSKAKIINKLIINSYIRSKNYEGAIEYYAKRHLPRDIYFQKITLYRALQLFQDSYFQEALPYFKTANTLIFDPETKVKSTYWNAETFYRLNKYKQALYYFKIFYKNRISKKFIEYENINYSIGYTYFKLKEYEKAKSNFEIFVKDKFAENPKLIDSYLRLGDCYFISKNYWKAMEYYNKVIKAKSVYSDYAEYQKAISYGFVKRNNQKIETLETFEKKYLKSSYIDDSLYELGNAYTNSKQNSKAINTFNKLIKNHKKSSYIPKAILKQGLIYFNDNKSKKAIERYKEIVKTYPKSKEAHQAIFNIRQVYVHIDKVDEYANWIKSIKYTSVTNTDLDNTMYEAAELKYLDNKMNQAISSFKKYLINFPDGLHVLEANFYSGQANFSEKNIEKATKHYQFIISQNTNEYTEQSLSKLAQIYLEKGLWNKAIPILKRLEEEANLTQNILFAQGNLMKGTYKNKEYKKTVIYAEKVLENKKSDDKIKSDAYVFIARSAIKTNDLEKAEKAYKKVSEIAKGVLKAEALYYDAFFKNQSKKYEESNGIIQKIVADYATYKKWGIKGLILMAKNNDGLDDIFQATYILESIIKNYSQFPNLIKEAQNELKAINKRTIEKNETDIIDF